MWKGYRVENNLSLTRNLRYFGLYQDWRVKTGQVLPMYGRSTPFLVWFGFVKVGDSRKSQILTRGVQGTDYFSSIFSHRSYIHLRSRLSLSPNRCSRHGATLRDICSLWSVEVLGPLSDDGMSLVLRHWMWPASFSPYREKSGSSSGHLEFWRYIQLYHQHRYSQMIELYSKADQLCNVERRLNWRVNLKGQRKKFLKINR